MKIDNNQFKNFVIGIKNRIISSQKEALRGVNKELINLYWDIGKSISKSQEENGWGKSVVENLSFELRRDFVGVRGFSARNLWNMRIFYENYKDSEKLQTLSAEIGWSHNVMIFQKCKDELEREFYIKSVIKFGWSYRVLDNQIANQTYEKYLLKQTNFDKTLPPQHQNAFLALKDEYSFDFLNLGDKYSEHELELSLIKNIRQFLIQMGSDFSFIGNQYKLEVGGEEFFVDMLLYHRRLKSLIAIELKVGKFKPQFAGKMNFYLSVLNDFVKLPDENQSIGIIICREKNKTIVEYALKDSKQPIGVASYKLTKTLPKNLKDMLPSSKEIALSLEAFLDAKEYV